VPKFSVPAPQIADFLGWAPSFRTPQALLVAYLYLPAGRELEDLIRFLIFPLLALSGAAMWQQPRLRRALKAARRRGLLRLPLAQARAVAARELARAEPRSLPTKRR
jgi:hypothetical protein